MKKINEKISKLLESKDLYGFMVTDPYNMHYISGFAGEGVLLITGDRKLLITDGRYTKWAKETLDLNEWDMRIQESGERRSIVISGEIKEASLSKDFKVSKDLRVGYEDQNLSVFDFAAIKKELPGVELVSLKDSLNEFRRIKTEEEIDLLREAEHIGDMAFSDVLPKIRPGISEIELCAHIEYSMKMHGASGLSFETIVASGPNSARPHHIPTSRKLSEGEFVVMDFGCVYEGYCSDMTRTVFLGRASEGQKHLYDTVLKAQMEALSGIRPGIKGKEADLIARNIIDNAGYKGLFGHGLGHSVGLYIHESPRLSPSEEAVLKEGMIETVEPGIYHEKLGGVRIEDMVVIRENGVENLTQSPKELMEIV